MSKNKGSDVYLWCEDGQKKFVGMSKTLLKTGDVVVDRSSDKRYKVKASACGLAIVKEFNNKQ